MLVGIDVAKAELVVGTRPAGERWAVANDERGMRALVERLMRDARRRAAGPSAPGSAAPARARSRSSRG